MDGQEYEYQTILDDSHSAPVARLVVIPRGGRPGPRYEFFGLIDSGADQTCLPFDCYEHFYKRGNGMPLKGLVGIGGEARGREAVVGISIQGVYIQDLPVAFVEGLEVALIGRDILNQYKVRLDGPDLVWQTL